MCADNRGSQTVAFLMMDHNHDAPSMYGLQPPPTPNLEALRAASRAIRESQPGLTIDVLAARSGMSRNSVINLLNGGRGGTLESWYLLAYGLGVRLSELVEHLDSDSG